MYNRVNTIHLDSRDTIDHDLSRVGHVIPYLEKNRLRPRLVAIQRRNRLIEYRTEVLGRALLAERVRTEVNRCDQIILLSPISSTTATTTRRLLRGLYPLLLSTHTGKE
jgi:hypothetical protein